MLKINSISVAARYFSPLALAIMLLATAPAASAADYENFLNLSRGFGSRTGTGTTGGNVSARDFGSHCTGNIDISPDHVISLNEDIYLNIEVNSGTDSTLLITGPGGVRCDDDSGNGTDAKITGYFPRGQYQIYVGKYGDSSGSYNLRIREN